MYFLKNLFLFVLASSFAVCSSCNQGERVSDDEYLSFEGRVKHNPDRFSPLPANAPFTISMNLEKDTVNGEQALKMQLKLHNPASDTIFLAAPGAGTPHFEFVVTELDCVRVWNRLQTNVLAMAEIPITLPPGETKQFQVNWNYTNYDDKPVAEGMYLVYGGIVMLHITEGFLGEEAKDFGDVGVKPDTLFIENQR